MQVWVRLGVMDDAIAQLLSGVRDGTLRPEYACFFFNTSLALLTHAASSSSSSAAVTTAGGDAPDDDRQQQQQGQGQGLAALDGGRRSSCGSRSRDRVARAPPVTAWQLRPVLEDQGGHEVTTAAEGGGTAPLPQQHYYTSSSVAEDVAVRAGMEMVAVAHERCWAYFRAGQRLAQIPLQAGDGRRLRGGAAKPGGGDGLRLMGRPQYRLMLGVCASVDDVRELLSELDELEEASSGGGGGGGGGPRAGHPSEEEPESELGQRGWLAWGAPSAGTQVRAAAEAAEAAQTAAAAAKEAAAAGGGAGPLPRWSRPTLQPPTWGGDVGFVEAVHDSYVRLGAPRAAVGALFSPRAMADAASATGACVCDGAVWCCSCGSSGAREPCEQSSARAAVRRADGSRCRCQQQAPPASGRQAVGSPAPATACLGCAPKADHVAHVAGADRRRGRRGPTHADASVGDSGQRRVGAGERVRGSLGGASCHRGSTRRVAAQLLPRRTRTARARSAASKGQPRGLDAPRFSRVCACLYPRYQIKRLFALIPISLTLLLL
jgi:hypothetical protein